jgi:hypothetical protein
LSVVSPKNETTAQKKPTAEIWAGAALGRLPPSLANSFILFDRPNTCFRLREFVDHLRQIGYWHESDSSIGREAAILSQFVLLECHR